MIVHKYNRKLRKIMWWFKNNNADLEEGVTRVAHWESLIHSK
jgi:hypothetical protein